MNTKAKTSYNEYEWEWAGLISGADRGEGKQVSEYVEQAR